MSCMRHGTAVKRTWVKRFGHDGRHLEPTQLQGSNGKGDEGTWRTI